ncbi:hypothetical protein B5S28_g615 [[Candida] boidinii]|nr:hypothetical protein B5S28_g615 [[Candida] boidinii]OWB72507.1 hypothetical protein B5S31_g2222 [[Candida] boidinii]
MTDVLPKNNTNGANNNNNNNNSNLEIINESFEDVSITYNSLARSHTLITTNFPRRNSSQQVSKSQSQQQQQHQPQQYHQQQQTQISSIPSTCSITSLNNDFSSTLNSSNSHINKSYSCGLSLNRSNTNPGGMISKNTSSWSVNNSKDQLLRSTTSLNNNSNVNINSLSNGNNYLNRSHSIASNTTINTNNTSNATITNHSINGSAGQLKHSNSISSSIISNNQRLKLHHTKSLKLNRKILHDDNVVNDNVDSMDFLSDDELPDDIIFYNVPYSRPLKSLVSKDSIFKKPVRQQQQQQQQQQQHQQQQRPPPQQQTSLNEQQCRRPPQIVAPNAVRDTNAGPMPQRADQQNQQLQHLPHINAISRNTSIDQSGSPTPSTFSTSTRASSVFSFGSSNLADQFYSNEKYHSFSSDISNYTSDLENLENLKRLSSLSQDVNLLTYELQKDKESQISEQTEQIIDYLRNLSVNNNANYDPLINQNQNNSNIKNDNIIRTNKSIKDSQEKKNNLSITRPAYLPPKDRYESSKHKKDYEVLMSIAIQNEANEEQKKLKHLNVVKKQQSLDLITWKEKIIPNYNKLIGLPQTRELWWRGLPDKIRSTIWLKQSINNNKFNLSDDDLDSIFKKSDDLILKACNYKLNKTKNINSSKREKINDNSKEYDIFKLVDEKSKEIRVAFPDLMVFQIGDCFESILKIIISVHVFNNDYKTIFNNLDFNNIKGLSKLTCVLYHNLKDIKLTFLALLNLLTKKLIYYLNLKTPTEDSTSYLNDIFNSFERCLYKTNLKIYNQFKINGIKPLDYLNLLMSNYFSSIFRINTCSRILDIYLFEGETFLLRTVLGLFKKIDYKLLGTKEEVLKILSDESSQVLNKDIYNYLQNDYEKNYSSNNDSNDSELLATFKYLDVGEEDEFIKSVRNILRK